MLALDLAVIGVLAYFQVVDQIPDSVYTIVGEDDEVEWNIPVEVSESVEALNVKNTQSGFQMTSRVEGSYDVEVRLFGLISLKKMNVKVIAKQKIAPYGEPAGLYVKADGLLVLGTDAVESSNGFRYEPVNHIVKAGDYITKWNGEKIVSIKNLKRKIEEGKGKEGILTIWRNREEIRVAVTPARGTDGKYKLGVWVREDTQGIGTISYITEDGKFGALGHGVTDADTGVLMQSVQGEIYEAQILDISKGKKGKPGELEGIISMTRKQQIGKIEKNTPLGVFGTVDAETQNKLADQFMPVAMKQEIEKGKAYICTRINGKKRNYEIQIRKINLASTDNKGMVLQVTDKELLSKTGGIVQGMSGSPILQNGKVIGAVTHVLVDDPTSGYGIFIENMLANQ